MKRKILDVSFLSVLIIFLLICIISVFSKSSNSLQVGVGCAFIIIILGVSIGTYFLGNKVNMLSVAGITFILLSVIFITILIYNNQENKETVIESYSTIPTGYKNENGQFVPTYRSCMSNLTGNEEESSTSNRETELRTEIEQAQNSCLALGSLQSELDKYQDENSISGMAQGPCVDDEGNVGMTLLSKGNICIPLSQIYQEDDGCTCLGEESETNGSSSGSGSSSTDSENLDSCINSLNSTAEGDMTGCYDRNADFNSICKQDYGNLYEMSTTSECPSPFVNKYRATCVLGTDGTSDLNSNEFTTGCYNLQTPLDNICYREAKNNGTRNFQKYGVRKYLKCTSKKNKRQAICASYFYEGLPTHQTNLTSCISADADNLNLKLGAICKYKGNKINQDLVPYNIKPYDCEFGKLRAECISRDKYNKIINKTNFYNEILY